jgi:hypothetical protein
MSKSSKIVSVAAMLGISLIAGEASATRDARIAAAGGFPLENPSSGGSGSLKQGYDCFATLPLSITNGGDGSISFNSTCATNTNAIWVMPIPTEIHATSVSITGFVVTQSASSTAPTVLMNIYNSAGVFSAGSGAVVPSTTAATQTSLTATLPVGGYAEIWAYLGASQVAINYAYTYNF